MLKCALRMYYIVACQRARPPGRDETRSVTLTWLFYQSIINIWWMFKDHDDGIFTHLTRTLLCSTMNNLLIKSMMLFWECWAMIIVSFGWECTENPRLSASLLLCDSFVSDKANKKLSPAAPMEPVLKNSFWPSFNWSEEFIVSQVWDKVQASLNNIR